jgi:N-acetylglucosamine kinase-like BadF-type ATPase
VLVIGGTGSIAFAQDSDGCRQRAGGLGPLLGDEGSAFWIGREWLRRRDVRRADLDVRAIAQQAPRVFARAAEDDLTARRILKEAQDHLAALVERAAKGLHWQGRLAVSSAGGLFRSAPFQSAFERRVARRLKRPLTFVPPQRDAAAALAAYGLRLVG